MASRRARPRDLGERTAVRIETIVPAPGICTPGSLHLPTITPSSRVGPKRTRFAASAPRRRATSSVTTSKTRSAAVSVATVTATRFSAACSSTSMRRSSSRCSARARRRPVGPEGVERRLVERLGADVDPASVLDADQQRLLDVERPLAVALALGAVDRDGVVVVGHDPEQLDPVGAARQLGGAPQERDDLVETAVVAAHRVGSRHVPDRIGREELEQARGIAADEALEAAAHESRVRMLAHESGPASRRPLRRRPSAAGRRPGSPCAGARRRPARRGPPSPSAAPSRARSPCARRARRRATPLPRAAPSARRAAPAPSRSPAAGRSRGTASRGSRTRPPRPPAPRAPARRTRSPSRSGSAARRGSAAPPRSRPGAAS